MSPSPQEIAECIAKIKNDSRQAYVERCLKTSGGCQQIPGALGWMLRASGGRALPPPYNDMLEMNDIMEMIIVSYTLKVVERCGSSAIDRSRALCLTGTTLHVGEYSVPKYQRILADALSVRALLDEISITFLRKVVYCVCEHLFSLVCKINHPSCCIISVTGDGGTPL